MDGWQMSEPSQEGHWWVRGKFGSEGVVRSKLVVVKKSLDGEMMADGNVIASHYGAGYVWHRAVPPEPPVDFDYVAMGC